MNTMYQDAVYRKCPAKSCNWFLNQSQCGPMYAWGSERETIGENGNIGKFPTDSPEQKRLANVSELLTSKITVKTQCPHLVIILLQRWGQAENQLKTKWDDNGSGDEGSEWMKRRGHTGWNERERGESEVELSAWCEWAWEMRGTYGPSLAPMMGICLVTDAHICMETSHQMTLYWLTLIQTSDLVFFLLELSTSNGNCFLSQ